MRRPSPSAGSRSCAVVLDRIPGEVQRDRAGRAGQPVDLGRVLELLEDVTRAARLREDAEARSRVAVAPGRRLHAECRQRLLDLMFVGHVLCEARFVVGDASGRCRRGTARRSQPRRHPASARSARVANDAETSSRISRQRGDSPAARACTRMLPIADASAGTGDDRQPGDVGGQLAERAVTGTAADHVDRRRPRGR